MGKKVIDQLHAILQKKKAHNDFLHSVLESPPTPVIFSPTFTEKFEESFFHFLNETSIATVHDLYEEQSKELFFLRNPDVYEDTPEAKKLLQTFLTNRCKDTEDRMYCGSWVYYPWTQKLVHILNTDEYQEIRTARNKFLITPQEQEQFRRYVVGICGLSIGNSVALTLAYSGGCEVMKVADPDRFATSNLNRVRVPLHYVGAKKVYVAAQQVYEINPFAKLSLYPEGITKKNIKGFIMGNPKLNIVIDEMDDLKMKIFIRLAARAIRLPLVMATDNGDNAIIDIDRFDQNPNIPPFDTLPSLDIDTVIQGIEFGEPLNMRIKERVRLSTRIVGAHNAVTRMQKSLMKVGSEIASWPQLGTTAFLGGVALTYVVKKFAAGDEVKNGKIHINLDTLFTPSEIMIRNTQDHQKSTEELLHYINDSNLVRHPNYEVWRISDTQFPRNASTEEQLRFILNYACMAPSSHNTQPWLFKVGSQMIDVYADFLRALPASDLEKREFYISIGACIKNITIALEWFGFSSQIHYFPEKNSAHIASISITKQKSRNEEIVQLFPAIQQRFSDRNLYEAKIIPQNIQDRIKNISIPDGAHIILVSKEADKKKIADLIERGAKKMMVDPLFRTELSEWVRHNFTKKPDGMPANTFGMNDIQSLLAPFLLKYVDLGDDQARHDREAVLHSPLLCVISTSENSPLSWVNAGEIYEHIVLLATLHNIHNATMASIIEMGELYQPLMKIAKTLYRPQVFVRLGYSKVQPLRSPRLAVADVMM